MVTMSHSAPRLALAHRTKRYLPITFRYMLTLLFGETSTMVATPQQLWANLLVIEIPAAHAVSWGCN